MGWDGTGWDGTGGGGGGGGGGGSSYPRSALYLTILNLVGGLPSLPDNGSIPASGYLNELYESQDLNEI